MCALRLILCWELPGTCLRQDYVHGWSRRYTVLCRQCLPQAREDDGTSSQHFPAKVFIICTMSDFWVFKKLAEHEHHLTKPLFHYWYQVNHLKTILWIMERVFFKETTLYYYNIYIRLWVYKFMGKPKDFHL
jgi:hypothetical protein